ncbi:MULTISPECIES: hypothetical protein [Haematospirillum]|uniref:Uncharacterized protein n=1 Tax=Haematospirillum jordaniae TaxID=1549855 RepID=A0A143DDV1_9PROT|nr:MULTISPECIES: hypothetical protein [Haematospirillum]AMW34308.1 hypothetical protein AY555_02915 [Haematospirillum jordaniae]NKD46289.1 hypothetical protein [Haematospirillum jordaniae]NKD55943.1 hypothetical protein [Haematospirillum sp. H4890]NKD58152.1 hypothetical protein [Haematospirillum jordaniae]NKD68201.1 hypothetical protein [Haematospirillum jordaniae]
MDDRLAILPLSVRAHRAWSLAWSARHGRKTEIRLFTELFKQSSDPNALIRRLVHSVEEVHP